MKVFAVTENVAYHGAEVMAIFSTYEKAKAHIEKNRLEEWEFDGVDRWNYYGNKSEYISIDTFTVDEDD